MGGSSSRKELPKSKYSGWEEKNEDPQLPIEDNGDIPTGCAITKATGFNENFVQIDNNEFENGNATYYVYKPEQVNEQGETDAFGNECSPMGYYVPIMEDKTTGEVYAIHWDPLKSIKENVDGTKYTLLPSSNGIFPVNCIFFQLAYSEKLGEQNRERVIQEVSSMLPKDDNGDKNAPSMVFTFEDKFDVKFRKATTIDKDFFILNKRRRIEFYSSNEYNEDVRVRNRLRKCVSAFLQVYPEESSSFLIS